jgi:intracellular sulfur oxidation DsrE/DsrF family protein
MAQSYEIKFIACENTIHSLSWTPDEMLDFATIEDVGAASIMELQEQGYAYLA